MGFLKSLVISLVERYVSKGIKWLVSFFKFQKKIKKQNEDIDKELKAVIEAVKKIKVKNLSKQDLSEEDIERLKDANKRLSSGFFH